MQTALSAQTASSRQTPHIKRPAEPTRSVHMARAPFQMSNIAAQSPTCIRLPRRFLQPPADVGHFHASLKGRVGHGAGSNRACGEGATLSGQVQITRAGMHSPGRPYARPAHQGTQSCPKGPQRWRKDKQTTTDDRCATTNINSFLHAHASEFHKTYNPPPPHTHTHTRGSRKLAET